MQVEGGSTDKLYLGFNSTHEKVCVGTKTGFEVWDVSQAKPAILYAQNFGKGIGLIALLANSNWLALVGGGTNPKWPLNQVVIWEDTGGTVVQTITCPKPVKKLYFTNQFIVTSVANAIYVNIGEKKQTKIETGSANGIMTLAQSSEEFIAAYSSSKKGFVCIKFGVDPTKPPKEIEAHPNEDIAQVTISDDGAYLATCSSNGMAIRVWDTSTFEMIEFTRGSSASKIVDMYFSRITCEDSNKPKYLACHSATSTTHIFYLNEGSQSVTGWLSSYVFTDAYIWSHTRCRSGLSRALVSFGPHNNESGHCFLLGEDGSYWKYTLKLGYDADKISQAFLKRDGDSEEDYESDEVESEDEEEVEEESEDDDEEEIYSD